jgi:hypothetical protein
MFLPFKKSLQTSPFKYFSILNTDISKDFVWLLKQCIHYYTYFLHFATLHLHSVSAAMDGGALINCGFFLAFIQRTGLNPGHTQGGYFA